MKKIVKILFTFSFVLIVGFVVAYYNTSSLGYDNANIVSFKIDGVQILDFDIKYQDVKNSVEKMESVMYIDFMSI